jgi:DUF1680 family protein
MIGALPEFIYSIAKDGIYVDLFTPSTIKFATQAGQMSLKMVTRFPYDQQVKLEVNVDKPMNSSIRIRIPSWAAQKVPILVNGSKLASGNPGSYVMLDRLWKNGDVISFNLPMSFKMSRYEGAERDSVHERYALEYGPILMAYVGMKGQKENLMLPTNPEKLIKSLKPVAGKPLHFMISGNNDFQYMPYFEVQEEYFTCFP